MPNTSEQKKNAVISALQAKYPDKEIKWEFNAFQNTLQIAIPKWLPATTGLCELKIGTMSADQCVASALETFASIKVDIIPDRS